MKRALVAVALAALVLGPIVWYILMLREEARRRQVEANPGAESSRDVAD